MAHSHGHDHGHSHGHHHHSPDDSMGKLIFAIIINIALTVVQVIGGILSGSLSLLADALHNLSDAGALIVAVIARKVGNKSASNTMSYGYKRAEIIGVLINSTTLIVVGVYLIFESFNRYLNPEPIDGWIVIGVAGVALIIDLATAFLTFTSGAKDNMNIRAAFIHNVSDAMASVVVIIAGTFIILYQWYVIDLIATIGISIYVIYHGILLLKQSILIIMQAVPSHIDIEKMKQQLNVIEGVEDLSHFHVWQLDDKKYFFEGHAKLNTTDSETVKNSIKAFLHDEYEIKHSTIETTQMLEADQNLDPLK